MFLIVIHVHILLSSRVSRSMNLLFTDINSKWTKFHNLDDNYNYLRYITWWKLIHLVPVILALIICMHIPIEGNNSWPFDQCLLVEEKLWPHTREVAFNESMERENVFTVHVVVAFLVIRGGGICLEQPLRGTIIHVELHYTWYFI